MTETATTAAPATAAHVPAVKAVGVHKAFGSLHVLKGIDLTVEPGTVTVILGPSGSGKSTFLRLINQLETLTAARSRSTASSSATSTSPRTARTCSRR